MDSIGFIFHFNDKRIIADNNEYIGGMEIALTIDRDILSIIGLNTLMSNANVYNV